MIDISIPPEVLEAGALATLEELDAIAGLIGATRVDGELTPEQQEFFRRIARASFEAMVEAWPGMDTIMLPRMMQPGHFVPQDYIRLPLTEKQDDRP